MARDPWRNALRAESITVTLPDETTTDLQTLLAQIEGGGVAVTWEDVTGKPASFPPAAHTHASTQIADSTAVGRSVVTAADATAVRTAAGAAAATHTHAAADVASGVLALARIPTGATASTVSLGNHTHAGLLSGSASAVADSTATDVAGAVADLNALLAVLRTRGVLSA